MTARSTHIQETPCPEAPSADDVTSGPGTNSVSSRWHNSNVIHSKLTLYTVRVDYTQGHKLLIPAPVLQQEGAYPIALRTTMAPINYELAARHTEVRSIPESICAVVITGLLIAIVFLLKVLICACCETEEPPARPYKKGLLDQSGISATTTKTEYSTHVSMVSNVNASAFSAMSQKPDEQMPPPQIPPSKTTTKTGTLPDELQLTSYHSSEGSISFKSKMKFDPSASNLDDLPSLQMISVRKQDSTKGGRSSNPGPVKTMAPSTNGPSPNAPGS